jgi:hypothetical protein
MVDVTQSQGIVATPHLTKYGTGQSSTEALGVRGEVLGNSVYGQYGVAGLNGNVFTTSVPAAATLTLPTTLATLASKFCLVNPQSSGKIYELIRLDYFINSATEVVNTIGLTKSNITTAGLTSLTAGVINNCNVNGGLNTTATFYVAATHADTPVWYKSLIGVNATAVGLFQGTYNFNGTVWLPPGNCIDLVTSVATQANSIPDLVWAEWPLS